MFPSWSVCTAVCVNTCMYICFSVHAVLMRKLVGWSPASLFGALTVEQPICRPLLTAGCWDVSGLPVGSRGRAASVPWSLGLLNNSQFPVTHPAETTDPALVPASSCGKWACRPHLLLAFVTDGRKY